MKKKVSESFPREPLISRSFEDIRSRQLTEKQKASLRAIKAHQEIGDDSKIDYSDIPPLTDEQLARMSRPAAKKLVTVRLDPDVLDWLQSLGEGYSTRINEILRTVMLHRQQP